MKKNILTIFIVVLSIIVFLLSFNYKQQQDPNTFYKVYLKDEVIGVIHSKKALEDYINQQNQSYKEKYKVPSVNAPTGLEIKKITTYTDKVNKIEEIYERLVQEEAFTIPGYQFNLRKGETIKQVYVTDKEIFDEAVRTTMKTFVGTEDYVIYNDTVQPEIVTTGRIIEDIYVEENITTKKTNIPVTETIYTNAEELSQFLVFGSERKKDTYTVKIGDTITDIALNHQISVEEFLISNTNFTSEKNLLFPGQEVVIEMTNPQISVAIESYMVEDQEARYQTNYEYDENEMQGVDKVIQVGENGLERVSSRVKVVNGVTEYINPIAKEELKPVVNEIILKGTKFIPSVGSPNNWYWPTISGWYVSSNYGYRISPITGRRELHTGLDLGGVGCGSEIYAVTNGKVVEAKYHYINGNYVCIDHSYGEYTCYNHMSKMLVKVGDVVSRGQRIGLTGDTGWATACHLHLEVWKGYPWKTSSVTGTFNPKIRFPGVFR